jgi:hypothetical protein
MSFELTRREASTNDTGSRTSRDGAFTDSPLPEWVRRIISPGKVAATLVGVSGGVLGDFSQPVDGLRLLNWL